MARRLGVLGTLVWDQIFARDVGRNGPVQEWGGIAYALSAFDAAGPAGWSLVPILKIGHDLRERARRLLGSFECVGSLEGVVVVPEPTNRVELHYVDAGRRCEKLSGGVPGWQWTELEPLVASCDAVYVNFIAGWEMELTTARRLRDAFSGPLYGDLHSLFLGVGPDGVRSLRPLEQGREWVRCFDLVQVNEEELETLAAGWGDPWRLAAEAVGGKTRALFVTLGERGAAWVAAGDFHGLYADPGGESRRSGPGRASGREAGEISGHPRLELPGTARSGHLAAEEIEGPADPTGCGDVWGITCFGSLLEGCGVEQAVRRANDVAARNARFRGATALARASGPDGRILRPGGGGSRDAR